LKLLEKKINRDSNLFLFGDQHIDNPLYNERLYYLFLDLICSEYEGVPEKYNYGIDHGDFMEAILITDKRMNRSLTQTPNFKKQDFILGQLNQAIKDRKPIKDKLITILQGNHPDKLWQFGNLTNQLCISLGVPYGTWLANINFLDKKGKFLFRHLCEHGRKTINSTADNSTRQRTNMELILQRQLKKKSGTALLMSKGHTHKILTKTPENSSYLVDNNGWFIMKRTKNNPSFDGFIHPDFRWYCSTGCFLEPYVHDVEGYNEMFDYDPLEPGFVVAKIRDGVIIGLDEIRLLTQSEEKIEVCIDKKT